MSKVKTIGMGLSTDRIDALRVHVNKTADYNSTNTIFRENMEALGERYPELFRRVVDASTKKDYTLIKQDEHFNLMCPDEQTLFYGSQDPITDCRIHFESFNLKNVKIALMLGVGLGYELFAYSNEFAEKNLTSYIIIAEKEIEIFKMALQVTNISRLIRDKRVFLMIGVDEKDHFVELRKIFSTLDVLINMKKIQPFYHPSSFRTNKDYYMHMIQALKDVTFYQICYFGNDPLDSIWGIENMFLNIKPILLSPGINLLKDKFKGKPGIVVSSGPSLEKNKHLLKGLEDKAVIICAESTLRALIKIGVKPHMVASLERTDMTLNSFQDFEPEQVENVYLAGCPVIPKKTYEIYPGPTMMVYRDFEHFRWLQVDKGVLKIKQSAGNMAFSEAAYLGCDPIILLGQDLAFSRDKSRTHVDGILEGEKQDQYYNTEIMTVMGNDGEPIETTNIWYEFLKSYEIDVEEYTGTCINCTEGGAFIRGTQVSTLQEAIDRYLQDDLQPLKIIRENFDEFSVEQARQDYHKVAKNIDEAIPALADIMKICDEAIELHEKNVDEFSPYLKNGEEIDDELRERIKAFSIETLALKDKIQLEGEAFRLLMMHVVQSFYIKFELDMTDIPDKYEDYELARLEIMLWQKRWFINMKEMTKIVKDIVERAKEDLESGMDEFFEKLDTYRGEVNVEALYKLFVAGNVRDN